MNKLKKNGFISISRLVIHLIMIFFGLFCLIPVLLIVTSSLMHEKDIFISGYTFFPEMGFTLDAYRQIFLNPQQLLNSYLVTLGTTVVGTGIGLWLTISLAYIISRKDFRFRKQVSFYVFFTMLFNGGLVPTYILVVSWLHLKDNYIALLLPYLCVGYNILLAKGFLQNTPESLIESAKLDGAGEMRTFVQIVLPISKPAIATVGLFIAFSYWNDWFQSMMYIVSDRKISLQYLLVRVSRNIEFLNSSFARQMMSTAGSAADIPAYTARMAMCVLAAGPILFIFPFFQKYFVKGLTIGSVKG